MAKGLTFVLLLGAAVLKAALFGAAHNQISYSVAPEYFHNLKFRQFSIPSYLHNRTGAAIVGAAASWWMGLLIGIPVLGLALMRIKGAVRLLVTGVQAVLLVLTITAIAALLALGGAFLWVTPDFAAHFNLPDDIREPVAFLRAGAMHEGGYIGGGLGLIAALVYVYRKGGSYETGQ